MKPKMAKGAFVFCSVNDAVLLGLKAKPQLVFREDEGTTIIVNKKEADANQLSYEGIWKMISITVHSDLAAVGFLAAITKSLAESGISVNAVSAYYHDHIFVPFEKANDALQALADLSLKTTVSNNTKPEKSQK